MSGLPQDPIPIRPINIFVPRDVFYDLAKMTKVTAKVLGRLGCEGCHSGRILQYQQLQDYIVNAKTLDVEELAVPGIGR